MKNLFILLVLAVIALPDARATDEPEIVVIVNPASGVEKLTRDEVIDIFLGRYRKLPSGRVALPIDVSEPSIERERFYEALVHKSTAEISSYWARLVFSGRTAPPFQATDVKSAINLVEGNPDAIAYVDSASVNPNVRVVLEVAR